MSKHYNDGAQAWLDGRPEDSIGAFKYVAFTSSDTDITLSAIKELSTLLAELGRNRETLAYLTKGEVLAQEDPIIQLEKGWNLLSLENHMDARTAFERALTLTADPDMIYQARLGLSLAEPYLSGPEDAIVQLQNIYQHYPYLLSPAAELVSANYEKLKKRQHAITFLKDSLNYDPRNIQSEIDLARLYEESDYYVPAWQTYYTLAELDPDEPLYENKVSKLEKYVKGKLDNLLYWTRIAWPVHDKPITYDEGPTVRIGLFGDRKGDPATLKELNFIYNCDFSIIDTRLGPIGGGKASMQWNIKYNHMNRIYELRDNTGSIVHSTRNSFRLVPKTKGGVILIKNPEPIVSRGINRGDRELTGELGVIIKEKGFKLINTVSMEAYVPAIAAALAPAPRLPEELKAASVVVRSKLANLKSVKPHGDPDLDICDTPHCITFSGMQTEIAPAVSAAQATKGEVLSRDGMPVAVNFHTACGGMTDEGANDGRTAPAKMTPFNLYKMTLQGPADNLFCVPDDKTTASEAYWTLILKPKWIEDRANRSHKIGYIRTMAVLKRSPTGKVQSLLLEGTAGSAKLEGFAEISRILAAGTLRSPLFTIRPIYDNKYPKLFIIRGIGTGDGKGYCVLGGKGMAKNLGTKYIEILNHYFPNYKVKKLLK